MTDYFDVDNVLNGNFAWADDINTIQKNIQLSEANIITDNEGASYVLDGEEKAFMLSVADPTKYIDQKNIPTDSSTLGLISIEDLSLRQKITLDKSSIKTLVIYVKDDYSYANIPLTCKIKQPDTTDEPGMVYGTVTQNISKTSGTQPIPISFNFGIDHLPEGIYEIIIEQTNSPHLYIQYDKSGSYNQGLAESVGGSDFNEVIGADLVFSVAYADNRTFDVVGSKASIAGQKIMTLDTHIDMLQASSYGDRKDLVCFKDDGTFEVIPGLVSNKPKTPDDKVPFGYLKIAELLVRQGVTKASDVVVSQDDTFGKFRQRYLLERVRRLEQETYYEMEFNSPGRVKWTMTGAPPGDPEDFLGDGTYGVAYNSDLKAYVLAASTGTKYTWTLKDPVTGINSSKNSNVSVGGGKAKLTFTSTPGTSTPGTPGTPATPNWTNTVVVERTRESDSGITNIASIIHPTNAAVSTYPAVYVYVPTAGGLNQLASDLRYFLNVERIYCECFKVNGNSYEYIDTSGVFQVRGRAVSYQGYDVIKQGAKYHAEDLSTMGILLPFPRGLWIEPGWYCFVFNVVPIIGSKRAVILANTWNDSSTDRSFMQHDQFGLMAGWYPMSNKVTGSERTGLSVYKRAYNTIDSYGLILAMPGNPGTPGTPGTSTPGSTTYNSPGVIQSVVENVNIVEGDDYAIQSVELDVNITLPEGTYYIKEVSNDGGRSFYKMTGNIYTFGHSVGNHEFVWRITLYSDGSDTPVIAYDDIDGYAIKASLTFGEATVNKGCLVTKVFDGENIIKQGLKLDSPLPDHGVLRRFSEWQWARIWAEAPLSKADETVQGKRMFISLEANEDPTVYEWHKVKGALRLGELFHGSVDYATYGGTYDNDEFNDHLLVDDNVTTDTTVIESFEDDINQGSGPNQLQTISVDENGTVLTFSSDLNPNAPAFWKNSNLGYDMSKYAQMRITMHSSRALSAGEFMLSLAAEEYDGHDWDTEQIVESFELPAIDAGEQRTFVIQSEEPLNLEDIKSVVFWSTTDLTNQTVITLDKLEGIDSPNYPILERYLRFRICMWRDNDQIPSPSIRQVGVIPLIQ
jgi:hypothetical protein